MDITKLKRIFDFLEEKESKSHENKGTFLWKLIFNEPLTNKDLNVKGDLYLRDSKITSLPEGLKVGGDLDLGWTKITSLPEGLEVGGILDLYWTNITSLPKVLKVDDYLNIRETTLLEYTDDELREMIQPGFIKGQIIR
jgi:hypothetical protein